MIADGNQDWQRADAFYETALGLTTDQSAVLNNWGYSKLTRGDALEAEKLFVRAIQTNPQLFTAKNNLMLARGAQRAYELPVVPMSQVERAQLLHTLALTAIKQNDVTIGRGLLQEAVDTHPQHFEEAVRALRASKATWQTRPVTGEALAAAWFLPFVIPLCVVTAYTDLKWMKITNKTVAALIVVFAIGGAFLYPVDEYLWRWVHLVVVLIAGVALNFGGALGAGDAKFMAAAAPFVMLSDLSLIFWMMAAMSLAGFAAHRLVRATPLRRLAPDWQSWHEGNRFPMGYPLGGALAAYLILKSLGA